uniref:Uncharacterized protein n=1 Tax=viral metagenome TaxID=1070528 RepID=A0A6M3KYE5_9ZZZZ
MKCYSCGTENPDVEGVSNPFDPDVDGPPYVKPEKVLRAEARDEDFRLGFRALASSIGKGSTGSAWEKAVALRKLILRSWDEFLLDKYGLDRGFNCDQPEPTKWEKHIQSLDWLLIHFAAEDDIVEAIANFVD